MSEDPYAAETEAMVADIREVFRGVSREGGVSWSESRVIDDYGSDAEREAARALDLEQNWFDLPDDPTWRVDMGVGGFSFLDPVGYRYYLPAAMTVAARGGSDEWLIYKLALSTRADLREYKLQQWSLLSASQRACVRRFIEYMIRANRVRPDWEGDGWADKWQSALVSFWKDI